MGKINFANLKKAAYYFRRNGLRSTLRAAAERLQEAGQPVYRWEPLPAEEAERQRERSAAGFSELTFSIVVPAYRTPERYLRELIESVRRQTYPGWELILADASGDDSVERVVRGCADGRIRYCRLSGNGGIAENTNRGLELATGDYAGLLDHDDLLAENALYEMADRIEREKQKGNILQMLYSDEDKCSGEGDLYYDPNRKEDFNPDLLLSNNYICHFLVMKRELMQSLSLRKEYEGAQDYDLVLRAAFALSGQEEKIAHIDKVLYHWRCHTSSTAENPQSKLYAYEAGRRAVQDFADRKGWNAKAEDTEHLGFYRLAYQGDIFAMRPELGAVGGPVVRKGKIVGGRMSGTGKIFYQGLPVSYSGYLHRAALHQQAEALDIRNMEVREELRELYEACAEGEGDEIEKSLRLSRAVRGAGYTLLYLPEKREKKPDRKR